MKIGNQICFKAMCLSYNASANEYHFFIQKLKKPLVIKKDNFIFVQGKPARFKATCIHLNSAGFTFNINGCNPGCLKIDLSQTDQKNNKVVYNFLRKCKIMFFFCWWRCCNR